MQLASRMRVARSGCEQMQFRQGRVAKHVQFLERDCARDGGSHIIAVWLHPCRSSVTLSFGKCPSHVRVPIHGVFKGFRWYSASLGSCKSINEELYGSPRSSNSALNLIHDVCDRVSAAQRAASNVRMRVSAWTWLCASVFACARFMRQAFIVCASSLFRIHCG